MAKLTKSKVAILREAHTELAILPGALYSKQLQDEATDLRKRGLLKVRGGRYYNYYKITVKGKKELHESEMTPRSRETLEKKKLVKV